MQWRLAEAKNKLSEVFNLALEEPQTIMRRNDSVVVMSQLDYEKLLGKKLSFKEFLLSGSVDLEGLDLNRDRSPMRGIDL